MPRVVLLLLFASLLAIAGNARAQAGGMLGAFKPHEDYARRVKAAETVAPLKSDLFGDQVSLYNGATEFAVVDIDLPGHGPAVRFGRRLKVESRKDVWPLSGVGSWDIDVPYLTGTFGQDRWDIGHNGATNRCSQRWSPEFYEYFELDDYWNGVRMHLPGQGDLPVVALHPDNVRPAGGQHDIWWTREDHRFSCLPATRNGYPGEGFVAIDRDGTRTTFDVGVERAAGQVARNVASTVGDVLSVRLTRVQVYLLASRVEDRHGNWVEYDYAGTRLTGIRASDGRRISFAHDAVGNIVSAEANGRRWQYHYRPIKMGWGETYQLHTVDLPDGTSWRYDYRNALGTHELLQPIYGNDDSSVGDFRCLEPLPTTDDFTLTATHPSGAVGVFEFDYARHYRSGTPNDCNYRYTSDGNQVHELRTADFFDNYTLKRKTVSGVGVAPAVWAYNYGVGGARARLPGIPCMTCKQSRTVTVTRPDGSRHRSTFGILYSYNDGLLLGEEIADADGKVLRSTTYAHPTPQEVQAQFPQLEGQLHGGDDPVVGRFRPVRKTTIVQDGAEFTRTVEHFDALGRPTATTSGNSLGYAKSERVEYHDDFDRWVLGQVRRQHLEQPTQAVVSETEYDHHARPVRQYSFGALQQQATYHADGQLATLADARGNVTALGQWKRGIPQSIVFADASRLSATVDDNGWITSATSQAGATTRYSHDPMGRLTRIDHPDNDSVAWADTTLAFLQATAPAYGLPAGHWRQDVRTGNAVTSRYLDSLWRPVLEVDYDATQVERTQRQVVRRFDMENRLVFESPALRGIADMAAVTQGTHTTYDALERVTRVVQDSELGPLATVTEYLDGLRTRATNPRGHATTVAHMAFDSPGETWPIAVTEPEDTHTQLVRDAFGKPTAIRRHSADGTVSLTRQFVYDAHQRLCKAIEPETGATVTEYDAAGNVAWSAAGLALPDANACNRNEAYDSGRRAVRAYDALNRPTLLDFPDGNGSQQWTYRPDGLVSRITTINDGEATTNTYDYNLRGLLTRETQAQGEDDALALAYAYDPHGHLAAVTYPSGLTVDYLPDALGQPTRAGAFATDVRFHPTGALHSLRAGNGTTRTITLNARGLPDRIRDVHGSLVLFDDGLDFDGNGNLMALSDGLPSARGNRTLRYDGRDRLVEAVSPMFGGPATYQYDVLDNLLRVRLADRRQDFHYDASNRLSNVIDATTGASTVGLAYDVQGNLANRNGRLHAFDYGNRLRRVAGLERYRYDGHGRRVTATTDDAAAAEIRSLYGQDGVLRHQRDTRSAQATDYIHLAGALVAKEITQIAPASPLLEAPGYSTDGAFTLAWTEVGGAAHYELEQKAEGGAWQRILAGAERTLALAGTPPGAWGYRVRACNASGCGAWSRESAVFVQTPPNPPSEVTVPLLGPNGSYTVTWLPPLTRDVGPTSYRLEERIGQGAWSQAYEGTALEHAFTARPAGVYAYRVTSCNPFGCSAPIEGANPVTVIYPPATPVLQVPGSQLTHTYSVNWSNVGADRYEVDEQLDGGTWARVHAAAGLSVTVSGRGTGLYGYRVRACNVAGCSAYTAVRTVQVTVPPVASPTLTAPATSNTGTYSVTWTAVAHATRYELHERVNGGTFVAIHDAAALAASRTALVGGAWDYRVRACNAAGCGPWSASKLTNVVPIHRAELVGFKVNGVATQAGLNLMTMLYGVRQTITLEVRNTGTHAWNKAGPYGVVLARNNAAHPMPAQTAASAAIVQPGQVAVFTYTFDPPYGPVSPMPIKDFGGAIWIQDLQQVLDVPIRRFYIENPSGYGSGSGSEDPR